MSKIAKLNMIDNSDKTGHYQVLVFANKNSVNSFQCPTLEDVLLEVRRIEAKRKPLPTTKAVYRKIVTRSGRRLILANQQTIKLPYLWEHLKEEA